jgi:hypothetical protein
MSNDFVCDQCGNVDSIFATQQTTPGMYVCHRCKHGEWHNQFSEERYNPDYHHDMLNRSGSDGNTTSFS